MAAIAPRRGIRGTADWLVRPGGGGGGGGYGGGGGGGGRGGRGGGRDGGGALIHGEDSTSAPWFVRAARPLDLWEIDVDPSSTPGQSPSQVVTSRVVAASCSAWPSGCTAPPEDPPDEVFVPCKVRFKMSTYQSCQVPQSVFVNLDPRYGCNELLNLNAIDQAVSACAGAAKAGELTVVYVGALTHPGHTCIDSSGAAFLVKGKASGGFSSPGNPPRVYMTSYGHNDDLTLAHEVGHTLGLSHVATEGNLMHANMDLNGPTLTASQCSTAFGVLP